MNDTLKTIIEKMRAALESDPDGLIIGKFRSGKEIDSSIFKDATKEYADFLAISNGARCGSIDLFPFEIMSESQSFLDLLENLEDAQEQWIYIGQVLYDPIIINKINGFVYHFYEGLPLEKRECYGTFEEFLINYVFGKRYSEIIPDANNDEWYQLLKRLQII
ncbi:hypothetical protein [Bacillus chungangensis]|uniref:SMI1/KNR4 family protein n=1 Tax=Bacillus chungangensis TaxID=587633 RepID=A0ABT9WYS3_9BACI|nr:hypothetical protein [Bacillus chungangensis]MDQ0178362.1 hypothetical protein [Bacillus chungangensis]